MSKLHASTFALPPKGAPDLEAVTQAMKDLCITIAWLRDPEKGCPWDLKQTHATLKPFMIEEAYEAAELMTEEPLEGLCGELGDVLLQVILNAQVAKDRGTFALQDVIRTLDEKMRRRHPHVFAPESPESGAPSDKDLRTSWESIKAREKNPSSSPKTNTSIFAEAKGKHPATLQAQAIGKIASRIDFDWASPHEVLDQVRSEVEEVAEELEYPTVNPARVAEEIGDVYFSLAQLCRHMNLDPEVLSLDANQKFLRRFSVLESLAGQQGLQVATAGRVALEQLWLQAKAEEKKQKA